MPSVPEADLEHILAHTSGLWEPMRGRNIFVTGGTGFFGRWILESFAFTNGRLGLGARMTVLTRNPAAFAARAPALAAHPHIRFIRGDVRSLECGRSEKYSYIIHAAAEPGSNDFLGTFDTIVEGTRAVLEFALGAGAERILLASSGAVYGPQPPDITHVSENYSGAPDCTRPASAYGEGKRAAESLCAAWHARHPALEPVIARCFAFAGPFLPLDGQFAVGNFIRDALRGGPIKIAGDGTSLRSYLYAADLAIWLWTMLFKGAAVRPYNVGSGAEVSILEVAKAVASSFPGDIPIEVAGKPTPGAAPLRYVPAVARAESELSLRPWIDFPTAVRKTVEWYAQSG